MSEVLQTFSKLIRVSEQGLGSQNKLTGFRSTELVQEADIHGKSFYSALKISTRSAAASAGFLPTVSRRASQQRYTVTGLSS